ncbi:hypothetical protein M378DRAFT_25835 [Amanita muscaria Koide BX008]|uniref:Uncharacterized protein n=1 Tax=Amanita muscaria (strain Koide BX008) TaxID=946122 RepID=A0A0C2WYM9_AMAMK|nr:hypothetical protein M378DRAFT_25835 [Amanita muscaria Koide BX008]
MPSSERKWNMSDVWRWLMHVPLSRVELDEPQRPGDGRRCGTNSRSHHRTGPACSRSRTDTEDSDAKEIRELKAKSGVQEKQIKRLEGKMAEQTHLLQEMLAKLTSVEQTVYKTQAIDRLEENIAKLDRDLQEMTAAIRSMVNRGDARKANRIQSPKANAPDWSQGTQDKIVEPSSAESRQSKRPALTVGHLETNVVLDPLLPNPLGSEDAGGKRNQKTSVTYQKRHHTTEGKRTNKPLPRAPIDRADSISVSEVAELVRALNSQLEQTSCLIVDALSYRQSPIGSEVVPNELRDYLGLWLCRDLQRRSSEPDTESDRLIAEIVLQTGLLNACSRIINGWTLPDIGQGVADARRAQARTYPSAESDNQGINEKYLTSILYELINAVGGSLQSDEQLPPLYQEEVEGIANKAVALHRIINEEATSLKLVTYTIPCGNEFDSSRMDDTEGKTVSTTHDRIVCTVGMGLQCREKVEQANSRQEYGVTMKAIVVLASTLEAHLKDRN